MPNLRTVCHPIMQGFTGELDKSSIILLGMNGENTHKSLVSIVLFRFKRRQKTTSDDPSFASLHSGMPEI